MSDLIERLNEAAKQFPVIDENPEYLFFEAAQRIAELEAHIVAADKHQTAEKPGDLCFNEVTGLHAEADLYRIAELEANNKLLRAKVEKYLKLLEELDPDSRNLAKRLK